MHLTHFNLFRGNVLQAHFSWFLVSIIIFIYLAWCILSLSLFFKQKTHWSHVCASEYATGSVLCHLSIFLVNVLLHHAEILGIYSLHGEADVDSKPGKIKMKNY